MPFCGLVELLRQMIKFVFIETRILIEIRHDPRNYTNQHEKCCLVSLSVISWIVFSFLFAAVRRVIVD